jgi:hypothetical protein
MGTGESSHYSMAFISVMINDSFKKCDNAAQQQSMSATRSCTFKIAPEN